MGATSLVGLRDLVKRLAVMMDGLGRADFSEKTFDNDRDGI